MLYYTKYADNKFDLLNRHKVFFTREQVEDAVLCPEKINKKSGLIAAKRDCVKVIYKKEQNIIKIITFFPIK